MQAAMTKNKNKVSDDRIVARIPRSNRVIIEKAAAVYGATVNQFIVQTVLDRATEILQREEVLKLTEKDARLFLDALDNPPAPNENLIKAMHQHDRLVVC